MAERARDPYLYSRFVRVVKFALPILAIAILSTVFLVQRSEQFDSRLVFSDLDRSALDDGLMVRDPEITGTTSSGAGYRITADSAVPDSTRVNEVRFTNIAARSESPDGRVVELFADQGQAELARSRVAVEGNVRITTSDGFHAQMPSAIADLPAGVIESGAVVVTGPPGRIEAGAMRVTTGTSQGETGTKEFFFFEKGVKLIHQPPKETAQ